jgi:hypothetical protein
MPDPTTDRASSTYGVHSEVGRLRKVLVCAPGLAHRRLTPTNADDLLFDDEMWVENAQRDHADFVNKLESRGVEVVELHELLAQTMAIPEAKEWLLDRKIIGSCAPSVGLFGATGSFAVVSLRVGRSPPGGCVSLPGVKGCGANGLRPCDGGCGPAGASVLVEMPTGSGSRPAVPGRGCQGQAPACPVAALAHPARRLAVKGGSR